MPEAAQAQRRRRSTDLYLSAAAGGAIGAGARYGMELAIPPLRDGWPTATFVVNLSGCLVLGFALVIAKELAPDPHASLLARRLRPFLITGVLGGYTTFSTFAFEAQTLLTGAGHDLALFYAVTSVGLGVGCVALALAIGEAIAERLRGRPRAILSDIRVVHAHERETEEEA